MPFRALCGLGRHMVEFSSNLHLISLAVCRGFLNEVEQAQDALLEPVAEEMRLHLLGVLAQRVHVSMLLCISGLNHLSLGRLVDVGNRVLDGLELLVVVCCSPSSGCLSVSPRGSGLDLVQHVLDALIPVALDEHLRCDAKKTLYTVTSLLCVRHEVQRAITRVASLALLLHRPPLVLLQSLRPAFDSILQLLLVALAQPFLNVTLCVLDHLLADALPERATVKYYRCSISDAVEVFIYLLNERYPPAAEDVVLHRDICRVHQRHRSQVELARSETEVEPRTNSFYPLFVARCRVAFQRIQHADSGLHWTTLSRLHRFPACNHQQHTMPLVPVWSLLIALSLLPAVVFKGSTRNSYVESVITFTLNVTNFKCNQL